MASKLTKRLHTDITRLKLLDKKDAEVRFRVEKNPFDDDEDDDEVMNKKLEEHVIVGLIYPKSNIYNQRAFRIEMVLTQTYPMDPPKIRFLTPVYHPNVGKDGSFCTELLQKQCSWTPTTSLVDVLNAVVKHIDEPNLDYAVSVELGRQYRENPVEFQNAANDYVLKHGLPRD